MKTVIGVVAIAGILSAPLSFAETKQVAPIQQQYSQYVEKGKSFKDAYAALAYEIAYETASVQSKQPCRTMVRGL